MVERMNEYGGNVFIASQNRISKVVEGHGTIWVASRTESKCLANRMESECGKTGEWMRAIMTQSLIHI